MSGLYVDGGNNTGPNGTSNVSPDGVADNVVTSASVTSATTVVTGDMTGFNGGSFQVTSAGTSCTVTYEQSNDGATWTALVVVPSNQTAGSAAGTSTTTGINAFTAAAAYVRARVSTYGSGTVSISLVRKRNAPPVSGLALATNTSLIGDVGQQYRTSATGAGTSYALMSPATPAAAAIKSGAGRVVGYYLQNSAAALRSVKLFNVAQGSVTLGTTAALFEIDIPAGGVASRSHEGGIAFSTAITNAVTSAKGLTDNTSTGLAANDVTGYILYA